MRTTVDLPPKLLQSAMKILKSSTKRDTIITALKKVISISKKNKIIDFQGKLNLNLDLNILRKRK